MPNSSLYLDEMEEVKDVRVRRPVVARISKPAYSARFETRKSAGPLSQSGAHRRRQKRGGL